MPETMRRRLERAEDERLAPYALRSERATRRHPVEDRGRAFDYRTAYQRDRDRIVFSRAFRRLRRKGPWGAGADEEHGRDRLTHTLEVAQVARTLGRALRLNEDLIEAVALGHEVGRPPFGGAGERALDDVLSGHAPLRGLPAVDLGGFWTGWQGLRVVDRLEKRYEHPGLNLTDDVREGILKVSSDGRLPPDPIDGFAAERARVFEVQAVALADRIVSALDDLEDGLRSGALEVPQVERLRAVGELRGKLGSDWKVRAGAFAKANVIHRGLTHLLVTGSILASESALARWAARHDVSDPPSLAARRGSIAGGEIAPSTPARRLLEELEGFLGERMRSGRESDLAEARGRGVVLGLVAAYHADPVLLDDHVLLRFKEQSGVRFLRDVPRGERKAELARRYRGDPRFLRIVCDHVASMTDPFAAAEHARLRDAVGPDGRTGEVR